MNQLEKKKSRRRKVNSKKKIEAEKNRRSRTSKISPKKQSREKKVDDLKMISNIQFGQIPFEVLLIIFEHTDPSTVILICSLVCRDFHFVISMQGLYLKLLCKRYKIRETLPLSNIRTRLRKVCILPNSTFRGYRMKHGTLVQVVMKVEYFRKLNMSVRNPKQTISMTGIVHSISKKPERIIIPYLPKYDFIIRKLRLVIKSRKLMDVIILPSFKFLPIRKYFHSIETFKSPQSTICPHLNYDFRHNQKTSKVQGERGHLWDFEIVCKTCLCQMSRGKKWIPNKNMFCGNNLNKNAYTKKIFDQFDIFECPKGEKQKKNDKSWETQRMFFHSFQEKMLNTLDGFYGCDYV